MKRTLLHSVPAFDALMTWYALRDAVQPFLGERLTAIFAHAVSAETDCLICSTFFRRLLIQSGENPDRLDLDPWETAVVAFGRQSRRDAARRARRDLRAGGREALPGADRGAHGLRRADGRDQRLQQRAECTAGRVPGALPQGRGAAWVSSAGKVALITGAAHGQGRATALALAAEGAAIVAFDVARPLSYPGYAMGTPDDLESLAAACRTAGGDCATVVGDVRDAAAVAKAVETALERFGRIDILFNNAGICAYGLAHELTEAAWDAMLDINLKGAWLVARQVIPVMIRQRSGVIINNSSVAGLRGMARLSHYAASKWGLTGLTKSWAIELAPHGIRVNSIHPTGVNTPMNDGLAELEGLTPRQIAERSAGNLLPVPWIEPEDVAQAVVYLASDRARFVTGAGLVLDAGLLTR